MALIYLTVLVKTLREYHLAIRHLLSTDISATYYSLNKPFNASYVPTF